MFILCVVRLYSQKVRDWPFLGIQTLEECLVWTAGIQHTLCESFVLTTWDSALLETALTFWNLDWKRPGEDGSHFLLSAETSVGPDPSSPEAGSALGLMVTGDTPFSHPTSSIQDSSHPSCTHTALRTGGPQTYFQGAR